MEFQGQLFVNHSPNVYSNLDTHVAKSIQQRRISPVAGPDGSGKTWMLRYWLEQSVYMPHILYIRMRYSTLHRSNDSADKATLVCFSAIDHELRLRELKEKGLITDDETTFKSSLWTKQQYYSLFHSLGYRLKKQHIHALIIDQAHHLNQNTWEELVALRDQCNESVALIPCLSYHSSGTAQEAWNYLEKRKPSSKASLVEIPYMSTERLKPTLLELWGKCGIAIDTEVQRYMTSIAEKVWTVTHGDWYAIMGIQATLDDIRNDTAILTMKHLHAIMHQYGLVKKTMNEAGKR